MIRKLLSSMLVALFALSLAGAAIAADVEGMVTAIEREGRYITVKSSDGKEVRIRISSSSTDLSGVGDRSQIQKGAKIKATYDEGDDRKTASMVNVTQ